jgi:hypothetical protein
VELPARTCDSHPIDSGSVVLVAHVQGGIAEVTRLGGDGATRYPQPISS